MTRAIPRRLLCMLLCVLLLVGLSAEAFAARVDTDTLELNGPEESGNTAFAVENMFPGDAETNDKGEPDASLLAPMPAFDPASSALTIPAVLLTEQTQAVTVTAAAVGPAAPVQSGPESTGPAAPAQEDPPAAAGTPPAQE